MSKKNGKHPEVAAFHRSMNIFTKGDHVKVVSAKHPDVMPGTVGVIDGLLEGGYWVKLYGSWMIAGGDRGQCYKGYETIWYESHELETTDQPADAPVS